MTSLAIDVDDRTGTLYAKLPGTRMVVSDHAPNDDDIVLNLDEKNRVIGVIIIDAVDADAESWLAHPDRALIPEEMLKHLDAWFRSRG